jgi:YihY family inner membrane protein
MGSGSLDRVTRVFSIAELERQGPTLRGSLVAVAKYLMRTDVHTFAFSVAANSILSLFPFIVLMLTISRRLFHSVAMEGVVGEMMRYLLPTGQDFVVKNMTLLAHARQRTEWLSLVMLMITSSGVFLPLEVALNSVWGVKQNRSYLANQMISLGLAFAVGMLVMMSIGLTAIQHEAYGHFTIGQNSGFFVNWLGKWVVQICAGIASVAIFFLIYWILPNRMIPARAVLPAAVVTGLLWEFAKMLYVKALPWLDFRSVYGPFSISVGLMFWAFLSGLLLLAGAHFSATRHAKLVTIEDETEEKLEKGQTPEPLHDMKD